ncbi:MAG: hypothetical protein IKD04_00075 [Clostridia bacterium]|nr:hypothetical protein [Clostridia bacterium]
MKSVTFNTSTSKKEVYLTIREMINSKSENNLLVGEINEDGFSIMKNNIFSNNVLNPQINATVIENKNGTEINMKTSLNKYDKIVFSFMGIILGGIFIFLVIYAMTSGTLASFFPALVALLLFIILVLIFSSFVFALKTKRIVKTLKDKLI